MAIPQIVAQAKQINVTDLVSRYVSLTRASSGEWQGPCPRCGGEDRLHCTADWWFCRQCHEKRGDAIDFLRHATGCTFQEATERLTHTQWPERVRREDYNTSVNLRKAEKHDDRDDAWFADAAALLKRHQLALPGSEGAAYLRGRGLQPATWAAFGLGFAHTTNRDANAELPAIAIPWYRGGKLTAIRYRFLRPPGKQKITSLPGSRFGGLLFGGQALPEWLRQPAAGDCPPAERLCTLIIVEGEINAMSIWQVAGGARLHVMSLGSESAHLSAGAAAFASRYGRVLVWMDKPDLAKTLCVQVDGAHACATPDGRDANDLLQAGILGGFLVEQRWRMAASDEDRRGLIYDLWDVAHEGAGLDSSTATAYAALCAHTGRHNDLCEAQPGVWVSAQRLMVA